MSDNNAMEQAKIDDTEQDPSLLLVRGNIDSKEESRDYSIKLSHAVLSVFSKHDVAKLRCVGAAAVNNAVKAIAIARQKLVNQKEEHDFDFAFIPSFNTVDFGENGEKTALMLEVIDIEIEDAPEVRNVINDDDEELETLLLVKGSSDDDESSKNYVNKLANANFNVVQKNDVSDLRSVGAASVNNAIKAIAVSRGEFAKKGIEIAVVPSFQTVFFGDKERTALVNSVIVL